MRVTLDFESASDCNLREAGAWAYWEHPTTEVLCLSLITDFGYLYEWVPGADEVLEQLRLWALDPLVIFEAHGAPFEQAGWHYVMVGQLELPPIPPERWDCTMARCYYRGLPGGLDLASRVLALDEQKDMEGSALTISLSKPMTQAAWQLQRPPDVPKAEWARRYVKGTYDRSRDTLQRVSRYCTQDVKTEMSLSAAVGPLSPYERKVWELDQRINQRGLKIDIEYVRACKEVVRLASIPLAAEFDRLTGGLAPTQVGKLTAWCHAQGFPIESLGKDVLKSYGIVGLEDDYEEGADVEGLGSAPGVDASIPENVKRALCLRAVLGSSSIAKLDSMLACVNSDGRVRYTQQYHGAHTGRTAGRLFQPTNFPRGKIEGGHDPEALVAAIMMVGRSGQSAVDYINQVFGDPIAAVASGLRHAVVAGRGNIFLTGDFAGIEARDVLGLAGQHDKTELMAAGHDVYLDMACVIYGRPLGTFNKHEHVPERTMGKSTLLGCGFGLGKDKFYDRFCSADQSIEFAKSCVDAYRKEWAPKVPPVWYALEDAALKAVHDKWHYEAYGCTYEYCGDWLAMHLPDGQTMWYRQPELCRRPMPWDKTDVRDGWSYWSFKEGQWKRVYAYGGLLCVGAGTKVLTPRGFVRIVDILLSDRLWDGGQWVAHDGVVAQGCKKTILFGGIEITPEHKVFSDGWKPAADSSYDRAVAICEALGRLAGWEPRYHTVPRAELVEGEPLAREVRLRKRESSNSEGLYQRARKFLRLQHQRSEAEERGQAPNAWNGDASGVLCVALNDGPLPAAYASGVAQLRRARNFCMRALETVRKFLGGHGADVPNRSVYRTDRQQRQLRAEQLSVGNSQRASEQSSENRSGCYTLGSAISQRSGETVGDRTVNFVVSPISGERTIPVYDILNAGPNRRFTVQGSDGRCIIVSNCENAVQKRARGYLVEASFRLEAAGYPLVLTVYDECMSEVPEAGADLKAYEQIMKEPTATSLAFKVPIDVEGWIGPRYRK